MQYEKSTSFCISLNCLHYVNVFNVLTPFSTEECGMCSLTSVLQFLHVCACVLVTELLQTAVGSLHITCCELNQELDQYLWFNHLDGAIVEVCSYITVNYSLLQTFSFFHLMFLLNAAEANKFKQLLMTFQCLSVFKVSW